MLTRVLCSLWAIGALGIGCPAPAAAETVPPAAITSALSVESDARAFPQEPAARTVMLPDDWWRSRPEAAGPVWYRLVFAVPATPPGGEMAIWFERACGDVEIQLNGTPLAGGGASRSSLASLCQGGHLVSLPAPLLQPGSNRLDLKLSGRPLERVASRERAAGLSAATIGPAADLSQRHTQHERLRAGLAQSLSVALAIVGMFLAAQFRRNRRDSAPGYAGLALVALAAAMLPQWLPARLGDGLLAEIVFASLWSVATLGVVQFLLRQAGRRERIVDIVLPLQCVLMPLSLAALAPDHLFGTTQAWIALFVIEIAAAAALLLSTLWSANRRAFWFMSCLLAAVVAGELLAYAGVHASVVWVATSGHLVLPALSLLAGLRLVQQGGRALESAEAGRALLEQRVAEVKAEIEANYRQLAELRVVQVTDRERKRIAADLHDDLGAKLLTIVHTSESERISTLAREALEEMRLSVRGLTGKPVRLEDALGDWRAEVISRLGQAGIEAVWNMPTDELEQTLPARAFVQTTRIIREAVNNIIKHSGASQCAVRSQVADGDFQLVIQDNGKGISVEVDGRLDRGHGLSTMKGRAKQLHGQCLVESGPGYGTVIRLTIPLEPAGLAA